MTFTKKILFALVLQPLLIMCAFYIVLDSGIKKEAYQNLVFQVNGIEKIFKGNLDQITNNLKFALKLAISDFAFKQAFASRDKETIVTLIENYQQRLKVDVFELLDEDGNFIVESDKLENMPVDNDYLVKAAQDGAVNYFGVNEGRAILYIISPIRAPVLIGYTRIGLVINESFMKPIADSSGTNLSMIITEGARKYSFSTLKDLKQTPQIVKMKGEHNLIKFTTSGGDQLGKEAKIYQGSDGSISMLLTKPDAELFSGFNDLQRLLQYLLVFAIVISVIIAVIWGKKISERLIRLSEAVSGISLEKLDMNLSDESKDEIGTLTRSFNRMTKQLALHIKKNQESHHTIETQKGQLEMSLKIAEKAMNTKNLVQFVDYAISQLVRMKGMSKCSFMMQQDVEGNFEIIADRNYSVREDKTIRGKTNVTFVNDLKIALKCLSERKPYVAHLTELASFPGYKDRNSLPKEGSYICIPLIAHETEIGVLNFISVEPVNYWVGSNHLIFLQLIAGKIALALSNLYLDQKASTDALTKLHNRASFMTHLEHEVARAARADKPLSLIFLDVDFFKKVNDEYGHDGGDQVLIGMGQILRDACRDTDFACRIGGEEFVLLLPYTPKDGAIILAERIRTQVKEHEFEVGDSKFNITSSFGVASLPLNAKDGQGLLKAADEALYKAKGNGRNRVESA